MKGLIEAVVLIVEEPYLISAILAVFLNATLPEEIGEDTETGEGGHSEWNRPTPLMTSEAKETSKAV
jgi:hypothetical protein